MCSPHRSNRDRAFELSQSPITPEAADLAQGLLKSFALSKGCLSPSSGSTMDWQHSHRNNFPVTDWSLVHAAGAPGDAHDSSAALEELLRRYEHPMRTHVLSRFRCQEQVAQD